MPLRGCWDPSVPSSRWHPELPLRAGRMTSARGPWSPVPGGMFPAGAPGGPAGTDGEEDTAAATGVEAAHQVTSHTVRASAPAPKVTARRTCFLRRDRPTRSDRPGTAHKWSQKTHRKPGGKRLHPVNLAPGATSVSSGLPVLSPASPSAASVPPSSRLRSHQTHQHAAQCFKSN